MNGSWFFDRNFNGLSDDFFDAIKLFDFPLEDVETNNVGEDGDANYQFPELPPSNVLAGLSNGYCGKMCPDSLEAPKNDSVSHNETSHLKQQSSTVETSSSGSILHSNSTSGKHSPVFQTSSPVSVLEISSSYSAENPKPFNPKLDVPVKRTRSKRPRPLTFNPQPAFPLIFSTTSASDEAQSSAAYESGSDTHPKPTKKKQKKKKNLTLLSCSIEIKKSSLQQPAATEIKKSSLQQPVVTEIKESSVQQPVATRKCTHCEVTKTPQWREGPMGPKTLCNACGVRYRSGRLLPEYRPASSPTFVPSMHSNSHRKVIEMRNKGSQPTTMGEMHTVSLPKSENSFE